MPTINQLVRKPRKAEPARNKVPVDRIVNTFGIDDLLAWTHSN